MPDTEWPLRLLSLDGGGIRGLSSILILKEIMKQVNKGRPADQILQPWQAFDLIGGTSTGGIIAIMLGCLRMSLEECESAYRNLSRKIFKPKRWRYSPMRLIDGFSLSERFDSRILETEIKKVIKQKKGDENYPLKDRGPNSSPCKVFVCTVLEQNTTPVLLRSYENYNEYDAPSDGFTLWQACRATSAATSYFQPHKQGNLRFVDGALAYNNPVFQVMIEANDLWKDRHAVLVSIGTGNAPPRGLEGNAIQLVRTLPKLVTQTEQTAENFFRSHRAMVERRFYYRFTVDGLGKVGLGDAGKIEMIEAETLDYIRKGSIGKDLHDCATMITDTHSPQAWKPKPKSVSDLTAAEKDCLKTLHRSGGQYEAHRIGLEKPAPGTCQWFLGHPRFEGWLSSQSTSLLWVTANPGCGKSVLSGFLVDAIAEKFPDALVCSFFFSAGDESRNKSHRALCAFLHQGIVATPEAAPLVMEEWNAKDPMAFTEGPETLWRVFCKLAGKTNRPVICILDALDECSTLSRNRLIDLLTTTFGGQSEKSGNGPAGLKMLVTSRPNPDIEDRFHSLATIRLRGENESSSVTGDIEKMIQHKVQELRDKSSLSVEACDLVTKTLTKRADCTFLWVSLVFESISRLHSRKLSVIRETLEHIPDDLDQLYESGLAGSSNPEQSKALLQIMLASPRPLSLEEINIALNIKAEDKSLNDLDGELEPDMEFTVKQLGRFFVRLSRDLVFFVHETAREFLIKTEGPASEPVHGWKHSIGLVESNALLAKACMQYLLLEGWPDREKPPINMDEQTRLNTQLLARIPTPKSKFFEYAAKNWAAFTQRTGRSYFGDQHAIELAGRLCDTSRAIFTTWWYFYSRPAFYIGPHPLYITQACDRKHYIHFAAMEGDFAIVKGLAAGSCSICEKNPRGIDALAVAAWHGRLVLVDWLLNNYEHNDMQCGTAMLFAVANRNMALVKRFVEAGVDINQKYWRPMTDGTSTWEYPLVTAVDTRFAKDLFLENGAVVVDEALAIASGRGDLDSLKTLLSRDVERSYEERMQGVKLALEAASEASQFPIRDFLFREFPQIGDGSDIFLGLEDAAGRDDLPAIRQAIQAGAKDQDEKALKRSLVLGSVNTAAFLLNEGSYSKSQLDNALKGFFDECTSTCMGSHILERMGRSLSKKPAARLYLCFQHFTGSAGVSCASLSIMMERNASLSDTDFDRAMACLIPMDESLAVMMVENADKLRPHAFDQSKYFFQACLWGRENLVEVLYSDDLDINGTAMFGATALFAAVISGNPTVVKFLLDRGGDPTKPCRCPGFNAALGSPEKPHAEGGVDANPAGDMCCANFKRCRSRVGDPRDAVTMQWDTARASLELDEEGHGESPLSMAGKLKYKDIEDELARVRRPGICNDVGAV